LHASISVAVLGESATSARIALICDKEPSADVRVRLRVNDAAVASLSAGEVVFTPADWRVTRFVEVTRLAPGTGPAPLEVRTSNAQSSDPEFSNLVVDDVGLDFAADSPIVDPHPPAPRVPF